MSECMISVTDLQNNNLCLVWHVFITKSLILGMPKITCAIKSIVEITLVSLLGCQF